MIPTPAAADRSCIAPTGCWWPRCTCEPAKACTDQAECDRAARCRSENHCARAVDAVGVVLPSQAALDSPSIEMPQGFTPEERRAFILGVAAAGKAGVNPSREPQGENCG